MKCIICLLAYFFIRKEQRYGIYHSRRRRICRKSGNNRHGDVGVGYGFVGWYEGETLIYKNASYTFEMPERNLAISAVFETLRKAELIVNATEGGTVGGTESGEYYVGTDITVTATPDDGYVFSGWYKGDSPVSKKSSYTFKMSENALTLTAKFENVDLWKGTTAPAFQGGSGTENDPYRIKNGAQLVLLSK